MDISKFPLFINWVNENTGGIRSETREDQRWRFMKTHFELLEPFFPDPVIDGGDNGAVCYLSSLLSLDRRRLRLSFPLKLFSFNYLVT